VRLRLEAEFRVGDVFFHLSGEAEKNRVVRDGTGAGLYEVWAEYVGEGFDFRLGGQIIIWGKADGVQITDIICPPDYTEFMTRSLDEIRRPVEAARLRLLGRRFDLEMTWVPLFRPGINPGPGNPWYPAGSPPEPARVRPGGLSGGEAAVKLSGYFSGLDVAASLSSVVDDFPVAERGEGARAPIRKASSAGTTA
jgi:hypothetical protein